MSVTRIGPYRIGKTLGIGSFSKVKLGVHELTGQKVAIKILNRKKLKKMDMGAKVRTEIEILRLFTHPHIIRLYEVIDTPTDIYTVMEYVSGGELFDYIVQKGKLEEKEARYFFQQIISGVEYCHVHMVVHRDLKPENLLLDADNHVKLADFGLSNMMKDGQFLKTSCGSPNYAAPEVISGNLYAGPEVDVWSCGVILYAILCGSLPFDDENIRNLFRKIKGGVYTIPSYVSKEARDLIARMLVVDPLKRITVNEIRAHAWFLTSLPTYLAASAEQQIEQSKTIDEETLNAVVTMGFDRQRVLQALAMGGELLTSRKMAHHVEARQMAVVYNLMLDLKRKKEQDESNRLLAEAKDKKQSADDVKARLGAVYGSSPNTASTGTAASGTSGPGGAATAAMKADSDAKLAAGLSGATLIGVGGSAASKDLKDLNAKEAVKCQDDIKNHNLTSASAVTNLFKGKSAAAAAGSSSPHAGTSTLAGVGSSSTALTVGGNAAGTVSIPLTPTSGATAKGRWFLGRWSNSEPQAIMKEVYRLLTKYNFEWKVLGVYKLKARYPPGLVDPTSGHGVHKNQVVKIGVQLYKTPRNLYVLDLQKLYGEMFLFLNFMSTFVSSIRI